MLERLSWNGLPNFECDRCTLHTHDRHSLATRSEKSISFGHCSGSLSPARARAHTQWQHFQMQRNAIFPFECQSIVFHPWYLPLAYYGFSTENTVVRNIHFFHTQKISLSIANEQLRRWAQSNRFLSSLRSHRYFAPLSFIVVRILLVSDFCGAHSVHKLHNIYRINWFLINFS